MGLVDLQMQLMTAASLASSRSSGATAASSTGKPDADDESKTKILQTLQVPFCIDVSAAVFNALQALLQKVLPLAEAEHKRGESGRAGVVSRRVTGRIQLFVSTVRTVCYRCDPICGLAKCMAPMGSVGFIRRLWPRRDIAVIMSGFVLLSPPGAGGVGPYISIAGYLIQLVRANLRRLVLSNVHPTDVGVFIGPAEDGQPLTLSPLHAALQV